MPPKIQRLLLPVPARARSREVASFFAQLDDLSRRMYADLADCTPAELAWQPAPGRNTVGMLLAHCALVEVFWLAVMNHDVPPAEWDRMMRRALAFDPEGDGMPLPPGGAPPRALKGWTLARHAKLHDRARAWARKAASRWTDAQLARPFRRTRHDGTLRVTSGRWVLYHLVEHLAGHYGQVLLLRHEYRDRKRR